MGVLSNHNKTTQGIVRPVTHAHLTVIDLLSMAAATRVFGVTKAEHASCVFAITTDSLSTDFIERTLEFGHDSCSWCHFCATRLKIRIWQCDLVAATCPGHENKNVLMMYDGM